MIKEIDIQNIKTDIEKFEKRYKKIDDGSTVIFHTGWQKNLEKKYLIN